MPVKYHGNEIAIIGMAGRFPGADNLAQFWQNLKNGVESVSFLTDEESLLFGADPELLALPNFVRAAAFMKGIELFDAGFFGYSPKEAEIMDPQHRIFLECAWEALENAGYNSDTYEGSISVYAGATINTYLLLNLSSNPRLLRSLDPVRINIANSGDFLTTRVSYKLNLTGPSHLIQCACSTSLVAVHVACQGLLAEESDIALAGGISINLSQRAGYLYYEGGMFSPDGHCRAFDANAQGTVFGSGTGIVVLKRLEDALRDRDYIHAVIKGSAVNNDGSLKIGYTAPGMEGQVKVITEALANAGIEAETVGYIEVHGTATPLGDPIEVEALTKAFRKITDKNNFCAIGSVKTNIGHLDAAAGISGLIKTGLALKHKMLPASLHFERPNPQIDFPNTPFYVNTKSSEWKTSSAPRRAGVSSFGVGGTNVHVIVEEAPEYVSDTSAESEALLLISAKTTSALDRIGENLADHIRNNPDDKLADIAYTLQVGRKPFKFRRMVLCRNRDAAIEMLTAKSVHTEGGELKGSEDYRVVFMFPGQGAQQIQMAAGLYRNKPEFRRVTDYCSEYLTPLLDIDLRLILYPDEVSRPAAECRINETWIAQPALFVVEYALAKLWMTWGVEPQAMIGHSIGEYTAACLAGVFSLEDALRLVACRGLMMQKLPKGAMMAVAMDEMELTPYLGGEISLAAVNSPAQCVVSGPDDEVDDLKRNLELEGLICRKLQTSHAFHSSMMDPMIEPFVAQAGKILLKPPTIPYLSGLTGTWVAPEQATNPKYWGDQLRHTVRFAEGISMLSQEKRRILLEVGPGQTLTRQVARSGRASADIVPIASLPSGREGRSDRDEQAEILTALGKLWLSGISINWSKFHAAEKRRRLPLPTYPFQHQRYWVEAKRQSTIAHPSDLVNLPGIPSDCQESNGERPGETHHPEQGGVGSYPGLDDQNNRLYPRPRLSTPLVPARSETEKIIAEIWQKTLGIASVGILDNFFDLGGDSLTAIRIIAQLKERMGADLPVVNLYESLNIKSLAEQFENSRDDGCRKHVVDSGINERSERVQSRKQHQANRRNRRVKS